MVDILPRRSGSMDLRIFAYSAPGIQNFANPTDPDPSTAIPDPKHCICVILYFYRSHTEIREGCSCTHPGCYTVFSAPNKSK